MKGRSNFLCISKLEQVADQALLKGLEELDAFQQIKNWARLTETGDRAELTFLPDDSELWMRLDARRDTCTGQKCPSFHPCFVTGMHQRAMRRLPEEFRTVLVLAEIEGLPLDDVARIMACPVGTVKSRLFAAREDLRSIWRSRRNDGRREK